jgi:putative membrane protein
MHSVDNGLHRFALGATLAGMALGCASHHYEEAPRGQTSTAENAPAAGQKNEMSDGEITSTVNAFIDGETAKAELARNNASTVEVRNFASSILSDTSSIKSDLGGIAQKMTMVPALDDDAKKFISTSNATLNSLKDKHGSDFDKTYIDSTIKDHRQMLDLLDNKLIPNAKLPELAGTLRNVRAKVSRHLMDAEQIQPSLAAI